MSGIKSICKNGGYDLAIAVHPSFSIAAGIWLGGVINRLGTGYRWYSFFFNLKHYEHRRESIKHETEYNLGLLEELDCKSSVKKMPHLVVSNDELESVKFKLESEGIPADKNFIVIHIPSMGSAKVWSDENFVKLIKMILNYENKAYNIILTGTKRDIPQVKSLEKKAAESAVNYKRLFTIFDLNLKELAALIKLSKIFIGNSSGPIHIAAAVDTFVIGLYSPVKEESPVRWGPLTEKKKVFVPDDNSGDVMNSIKPEAVFEFIKNNF